MRYLFLYLASSIAFANQVSKKDIECNVVCPREVERAHGGKFNGKESCTCFVDIDYEAATQSRTAFYHPKKITATELEDTRETRSYSEED